MKLHYTALVLIGISLLGVAGLAARGEAATLSAPPLPASSAATWTRDVFPIGGGHVIESSPVMADLDKDGVQEILVGTTRIQDSSNPPSYTAQARLVAMRPNGVLLWGVNLDAPMRSSPAVADIDGDGDLEVVVSLGGDVADMAHPGGIAVYSHTGALVWRFYTQDHAGNSTGADGFPDGVFSTPALCDLDGDGKTEIVFGAWDQRIYVLGHDKQVLWHNLPSGFPGPGFYNADSIWSSPACADFNGDGDLEIVIGADITGSDNGGGILPDGYAPLSGGFLYVFDRFGHVLVRRWVDETIFSSPAIGDLDGNGTLEIVVGTGYYWWDVKGRTKKNYVYAFSSANLFGNMTYWDANKLPHLPGWPQETTYPGFSSPALADFDNDGDLEIVIGSGEPYSTRAGDPVPGQGEIHVWHHTGARAAGWPIRPVNAQNFDAQAVSSPVIADVDNDGQLEIIFSYIWDIQVYNFNGTRENLHQTTWTVVGSPLIGDADGDGQVEIWIGASRSNEPGLGQNDNDLQGYMWRFESDQAGIGAMPWPMFHRDLHHSGLAPRPASLKSNVSTLSLRHDINTPSTRGTENVPVTLRNTGDMVGSWSVAAKPSGVSVSPSSGLLKGGQSATVYVTVDLTGLPSGFSTLGSIQFSMLDTPQSQSTQSRTLDIPVSVDLGVFHYISLPHVAGGNSARSSVDLFYSSVDWIRLSGGQVRESSPMLADLDNDGREEILVGSTAQSCTAGQNCNFNAPTFLHVYRADGSLFWERNTAAPVMSAPAVGNLDNRGLPEVVVSVGGDPQDPKKGGRVIAYTATGTELWSFASADRNGDGAADGIFSSPALCDLDGNGALEVLFGSWDSFVYALNGQGQLLWKVETGWDVWSSPACADFNGDGAQEVVIGSSGDSRSGTWPYNGSIIVLGGDGRMLVRHPMPEAIYASPTIADLDGDGRLEIVTGTGWYWWNQSGRTAPTYVYVLDTAQLFDGVLTNKPGWPQQTDYPGFGSPSLGDLDNDGKLEILIGTNDPFLKDGEDPNTEGAGSIYAWRHTGELMPGWPVRRPKDPRGNDTAIRTTPVIADIDLDGKPEVIVAAVWEVFIFNNDGTRQEYSIRSRYTLWGTPAVGDTDKDGKIELWVGGSFYPGGDIAGGDSDDRGYLWRFESDFAGFGRLDWPLFRGNARNTGSR